MGFGFEVWGLGLGFGFGVRKYPRQMARQSHLGEGRERIEEREVMDLDEGSADHVARPVEAVRAVDHRDLPIQVAIPRHAGKTIGHRAREREGERWRKGVWRGTAVHVGRIGHVGRACVHSETQVGGAACRTAPSFDAL